MNTRTNSLTAAAITLGIDIEVLEQFLPTMRNVDAINKERHQKQYSNPYENQPGFTLHFDAKFPTLPARILNTDTSEQCGTPGAPPCTCGE